MDSDITNDKEENKNYNFKPDEVFKYIFTNLSNKTRINLLNVIFNLKLEEDTEIEIVNTENVILDLIKNEFKDTRSDVILDLNYKRKIHLEFQTTKDNEMGLRVFLYGLGLAMSEKGVKNNILKFPVSHVLYTVLYGKPMYGEDVIILDVPNCKIENKYYEDCRIEIRVMY